MYKKLCIIMSVIMILTFMPSNVVTVWAVDPISDLTFSTGQGNGSESNPYQLATVEDLALLADIVNGTNGKTANRCEGTYFKLTSDIGTTDNPVTTVIGNYGNNFGGHFNGNNKTVTLHIDQNGNGYAGLFGVLGEGGTINNVTTAGIVICAGWNDYVGGVCGYLVGRQISITACSNTATVTGTYAGGVCGYTNGSNNISSVTSNKYLTQ